MKLNTASAVISFVKELEDKSSRFYEGASSKYIAGKEMFTSFAMENRKNRAFVERVYYGVISDALEGCFSFEGIDTDDYRLDNMLADGADYFEALLTAMVMEEKIVAFYLAAGGASESLMADIPKAFEKIARKKEERIARLKSLINGG
jgi:hypothetical protein